MARESIRPVRAADILLRLESYGGRLQGCNFELMQRSAEIELLGLPRWTERHSDTLIAALGYDFTGVGTPERTVIFPADWGIPEWGIPMNGSGPTNCSA